MSVLGSNGKWTSGEAVRPYLGLRVGDAVPPERRFRKAFHSFKDVLIILFNRDFFAFSVLT